MHIQKQKVMEIYSEGIVTTSIMRPENKESFRLREIILDFQKHFHQMDDDTRRKARAEMQIVMRRLREMCLVREYVKNNLVLTEGLLQITKGLSDNLSSLNELKINYAAIGTGATTPAAADSQLTAEYFRNVITSLNYDNGNLFAGMYLDYAEGNTTIKEGGLFIEGTATADSGYMFNHVLLEAPAGITKTISDLATINYQITFTAV